MLARNLDSERLSLRPLGAEDENALHVLWTDERVRRFLWDGEMIPMEHTHQVIDKSLRMFDEHGYGIWTVREHGSDELCGFCGYWHFRTPPSLELLFGVAAAHWNRGIATEAGQRVIRYAFENLGFSSVEASTDSGNIGSIRVLEKLEMRLSRRETVEGLDTVFYSMTLKDWRNAN